MSSFWHKSYWKRTIKYGCCPSQENKFLINAEIILKICFYFQKISPKSLQFNSIKIPWHHYQFPNFNYFSYLLVWQRYIISNNHDQLPCTDVCNYFGLIKEVRGLEIRMLGIAKFIIQDNTILIYKLLPTGMIIQKQRRRKEAQEMEDC